MTVTLAAVHEQLRRDTARMFKYDINALTAAQEVRLSRACMLRLELDDCETKKLAGQPFDINKYVVASEALERLLGGDPEAAAGADDFETRYQARIQAEFDGEFEKLSQLLSDVAGRVDAADRRESPRLKAEIVELKAALAEKDALIEQLRSTSPPTSASPTPPAATQSPQQTSNQPPLPRPQSSAPPSHYLRGPDEPWRVYQGGRYDRWSNRG